MTCKQCGALKGHKLECTQPFMDYADVKDMPLGKSSGVKYDHGKPLMYLIPPNMEMQLAAVLSFGAVKYGPGNWRELDDLKNRYLSAAMRHINAIRRGEDYDEETGLLHAAHAVACLMFLGEHHIETENPWKRAPAKE